MDPNVSTVHARNKLDTMSSDDDDAFLDDLAEDVAQDNNQLKEQAGQNIQFWFYLTTTCMLIIFIWYLLWELRRH